MTNIPIDVGPLEPLLADPTITAITIDEQGVRFIRNGLTQTSAIAFENDARRWQVIESILTACGQTLSAAQPTVGCTLSDGTRVRAGLAPLTLSLHKRGSEQGI